MGEISSKNPERVQLHLVLPYNIEARRDSRVRGYLDRGYHIAELQRVTDREVLVTFQKDSSPG